MVRVIRATPGQVVTDDGYAYRWPQGGEQVDVLPHHLWLFDDSYERVEVETVDPPLVLPALTMLEVADDTRLIPVPADEVLDLSGAKVKKAVLPDPERVPDTRVVPEPVEETLRLPKAKTRPDKPEPMVLPDTLVVPEPADEVADLSHVDVPEPDLPEPEPLPATAVAPEVVPEPVVKVKVTDLWSPADVDLYERGG